MDTFEELRGAIVDGEVDKACAMVQQQLMQGTAAGVLLNHALIAAMGEVRSAFSARSFSYQR
jgi:methanogenic corrinoid protein MtbC1